MTFKSIKLAALAAALIASLFCVADASRPAVAAPVTTHPRLWITKSDVPRLQLWAVTTNPMYANGLLASAQFAKARADANWNWATGVPGPGWADTGSGSWEGDQTEAYAQMFAFMSLVDPDATNRTQWAMRAHAMLMWMIDQAALGIADGQPFRDSQFMTFNRANIWGECWGLTVDWIYPSLTPADKATIRKVFLIWGNEILTVANRSGTSPILPGVLNDPRVLGNDPTLSAYNQAGEQQQLRWAANNYSIGEFRTLMILSLALDPADDPAVDPSKPVTQIGNSVRSYIGDSIGWWLYRIYAVFEDASTVKTALNLNTPNISLGLAAGGLPVEGTLYGESQGFLAKALLALQTAGYNDPANWGPQSGFIDSSYWTKLVDGILHRIAPEPYFPSASSGWGFQGQTWPEATYGDVLRTWFEPGSLHTLGALGVYDYKTGNHVRLAKERWISENVFTGGATGLYERASNVWGNSDATTSILYFLLFAPTTAKPADPRPKLATQFVAPAIGTVYARSAWTKNASWFAYRCSWETINHISGDCGQFQYWRKGQFLTKEWSNYADDWYGYTSRYHNIMALQNDQIGISTIWDVADATGSQWNNGGSNGDPTTMVSANDNYAFAQSDATLLYNHPDWWTATSNARDIQHASRSIVWFNPDTIVVYDRAISGKANRFKRFNLVLMNKPTFSGKTATIHSVGEKLTVQSLLPVNATLREEHLWTTNPAQEVNATALLDTSYDRLIIEDVSNPSNVQFLTVLQGTDAAATPAQSVAVHSSAGIACDGAAFGNTVAMFPVTLGQAFTSTSYGVASTVTRHLISGLVPAAAYDVGMNVAGAQLTVTVTPGTHYVADPAGVITVGFPVSADPTIGGSVVGQAMVSPNTGGGGGGGSGGGGGGTGGGFPTSGHGAPTTLATDGFYYYDNWDQVTFWQQNSQWLVINGGVTQTYTAIATGYQGPGAPQQMIADGTSYFDTIESRYYVQQGNAWVLILSSPSKAMRHAG